MFAPNKYDILIERPKAWYPQIPLQECEINQIHRMVFYFTSFFETIDIICLCCYARLRYTWASNKNIFRMIIIVRRRVVDFVYILESFKALAR